MGMKRSRLGSLDVTSIGLGLIQSEVRVLELPMLIGSYDELDFVRNKLDGEIRKKFEDKGYVLLGWGLNIVIGLARALLARADQIHVRAFLQPRSTQNRFA